MWICILALGGVLDQVNQLLSLLVGANALLQYASILRSGNKKVSQRVLEGSNVWGGETKETGSTESRYHLELCLQ